MFGLLAKFQYQVVIKTSVLYCWSPGFDVQTDVKANYLQVSCLIILKYFNVFFSSYMKKLLLKMLNRTSPLIEENSYVVFGLNYGVSDRLPWFSSVLPSKCWDDTLNYITATFFHILHILSITDISPYIM